MSAKGDVTRASDQESWPLSIQRDIVVYTKNGGIDVTTFNRKVATIRQHLARRPELRWALICEDTFWFAVGFLALSQSHKIIIIPQTNQLASVLTAQVSVILTDQPACYATTVATLDITSVPEFEAHENMGPDLDLSISIELYTSGSTGFPKRVNKHLSQLRAEVSELETIWGEHLGSAVVLATVPHHHLYGLLFRFLWPWWMGRPFYAPTCIYPATLLEAAGRFDRCVIVSSPAFLTRVADFRIFRPVSSYPALFSSGAPLPIDTAKKIATELEKSAIEVYGSTETGGIGWRTWSRDREDLSWQPFLSVETKISGHSWKEPGHLLIRSPWTCCDDWVDTGDMAQHLSPEKFLLCGRADNIMKVEDKRVSLTEMEQFLITHELVSEARIVVLEGKRMTVGAVVVLSKKGGEQLACHGTRAVRAELIKMLRACYDPILVPRKWRFVPVIPGNSMGKSELERLRTLFME